MKKLILSVGLVMVILSTIVPTLASPISDDDSGVREQFVEAILPDISGFHWICYPDWVGPFPLGVPVTVCIFY